MLNTNYLEVSRQVKNICSGVQQCLQSLSNLHKIVDDIDKSETKMLLEEIADKLRQSQNPHKKESE